MPEGERHLARPAGWPSVYVMFASLLPGLRDLRVPLASGLIWLIAAWLLVEPHIPDEEPTGVLGSLYRLEGAFGAAFLTAATLFIAYLVGIMLPYYKLPVHRIQRLWTKKITDGQQLLAISVNARAELLRFIEQPVREAARILAEAGRWGDEQEALKESESIWTINLQVVENILHEEEFLALRLLSQDKEPLYQSYDRKIAEAQFRQGLTMPTAALVVVLAITASPYWLFAFVIPGVLGALSLSSRRDAMNDLSHAIVSGAIQSSAITLLQQVVKAGDVGQIRLWTSSSPRLSLYGYFLQSHDGAEPKLPHASSDVQGVRGVRR